jgi:general stress protein YciG
MEQNKNKSGQDSGRGGNRNDASTGRGFASMDKDQQREIASEGGRAAHEKGVAHEWDSEEAAEAGRKGGQAAHKGGAQKVADNTGRKNSGSRNSGNTSRGGGRNK